MRHTDPFNTLQQLEAQRAAQVGEPFDPKELLHLATEQWPDLPLVAATFAVCTLEWPESEWYTHFMSYTDSQAHPYAGGKLLTHPTLGDLQVDFGYDDRVEGGVRVLGIEYLDRVMGVLEQHDDGEPVPTMRAVHVHTDDAPSTGPSAEMARGSKLDNGHTTMAPAASQPAPDTEWHPMHGMDEDQEYLDWYLRKNDRVGMPFDPTELVHLALEQWPLKPLVAVTFAQCTAHWSPTDLYSYFLCDADRATFRICGGAYLHHPTLGNLVVDLAQDASVPGGIRVIGMEYLTRAMAQRGEAKPTMRVVR